MTILIEEEDLVKELKSMLDLNYHGTHNTGHKKIPCCMRLSKENLNTIATAIVEGLKPVYGQDESCYVPDNYENRDED